MLKGVIGYLLKDSNTVVLHKSDFKNAKDKDFEDVHVLINEEDIRNWAEELDFLEEEEEEEEE